MHSEEQEVLRRLVRAFLADTSPMPETRRLMETEGGYDPTVWARMADEIGLQGLHIPEAYGGSGFGWVELAIVFEGMGRSLLCAPFLGTVALAAGALLHAGDERAAHDLLPGMASGRTIATLAVAEDRGGWGKDGVAAIARPEGDGSDRWTLHGQKSYVLDGHIADLILVAARAPAGIGLFAVDAGAPHVSRAPMPAMDLTRKLARLEMDGTPARLVGEEGKGWPAVVHALALGAVALAAEQVGGAQRCLEMAVGHAKTRVQFNRPIGGFQAVKHRLADLLMEVEAAKSAAAYAAWAADNAGPSEMYLAASLAKAYCSEAYTHAAAACIQIHGAIGVTWEHDAHLYFKRAKSSSLLLGEPTYHRGLVANGLGL